jgi:hypothetical protein
VIIALIFAGASLGLSVFALALIFIYSAPVDVGPRKSVLPRVDIRC